MTDEAPLKAARLTMNWHCMSVLFGINHGTATTPMIFASTLLDKQVGYMGNSMLYVFTCVSALFLCLPILAAKGQRGALRLGMTLYAMYAGSFALAAMSPNGSWQQWFIFLPGSSLGGIASSLVWTAQGVYMDRSVTATLRTKTEGSRQQATASHSSAFAAYYLFFEVACKLAASTALSFGVTPPVIFSACLAFGIASAAGCGALLDLGHAQGNQQACDKLLKAVKLWPNPIIWFLSLTNLTFGFTAAFMNGYVNATYTKEQLGNQYVGFFASVTAVTAAVLSLVFGAAAKRIGAKGPFLLLGSVCFFAIPALVLSVSVDGWGAWLSVFYLLQGCGRAVYESINKGVFADYFPGELSEGAFANSMMQSGLSFAFGFFFSATLPQWAPWIILVFAVPIYPCFLAAKRLRREREGGLDGTARLPLVAAAS